MGAGKETRPSRAWKWGKGKASQQKRGNIEKVQVSGGAEFTLRREPCAGALGKVKPGQISLPSPPSLLLPRLIKRFAEHSHHFSSARLDHIFQPFRYKTLELLIQ